MMIITRGFGAKEIEYVSVPTSDPEVTSSELIPNMTGQVEIQDGPRIINTFSVPENI